MGISEAGLQLPTGAEEYDLMINDYEAITGLTVDRARTADQFITVDATITANAFGRLYELLQAIYDGTDSEGAIGKQAEDLAFLVGVIPDPATKSQATVTIAGVVGTIITSSHVVEGSINGGRDRWLTSSDVTIGVGGTVDVVVVAQEAGLILAEPGDISKIITAVPGWTSVTNAAAAEPGELRQSDALLRLERRVAQKKNGSASTSSMRGALLDLTFVDEVIIVENRDAAAQTISGLPMNPHSVHVIIVPDTLTAAQETTVAETLHLKLAPGTEMMSTAGGTERIKEVSDFGGETSATVKWNYGAKIPTIVTVTVTLEGNFALTDVTSAIQSATAAFMTTFTLGKTLTSFDLTTALAGIDGIASAVMTIDLGALPYTPGINELLELADIPIPVIVTL